MRALAGIGALAFLAGVAATIWLIAFGGAWNGPGWLWYAWLAGAAGFGLMTWAQKGAHHD
jgi:hypothetical protein